MKKTIFAAALLAATFVFGSANAATVNPVAGVVAEQARGGIAGLEFGELNAA